MSVKKKLINITTVLARIIFGATFVFSGFVKAVDPIGLAYKIEDYLIAFQLTSFIPAALLLSVILIVVEFLLGVFILLGLNRRVTTIIGLLFMLVMTPVTFYIALYNPVEDCGCFGDALIIDNWTTFYKNIILISLIFFLFFYYKSIKPLFTKSTKLYVTLFVIIFSFLFCIYNILYLPIMDFRPYKIGADIQKQIEDDLKSGDVYENIYVYEKDGVKEEFTEENFPWEDSSWTFVELKSELIKEGDKPIIEGFHIIEYETDSTGALVTGSDITNEMLQNPLSLWAISLSLDKANSSALKKIISLSYYAHQNNIDFYLLTASDIGIIESWSERNKATSIKFASMDELTLKTIIRYNPGLLLMQKGVVVGKWSGRALPDEYTIEKQISKADNKISNNKMYMILFIVCVIFFIPLIVLWLWDKEKRLN